MHNSYKLLTKKHIKYGIPDIYILHKTIQELRIIFGKGVSTLMDIPIWQPITLGKMGDLNHCS